MKRCTDASNIRLAKSGVLYKRLSEAKDVMLFEEVGVLKMTDRDAAQPEILPLGGDEMGNVEEVDAGEVIGREE